jgi:hypothetical protein
MPRWGNNRSLSLVEVKLNSAGQPVGVGAKMDSVQSSGNYPALVATDKGLFIMYLGNGNGNPGIAKVNVP